jgi:hypothetical protein
LPARCLRGGLGLACRRAARHLRWRAVGNGQGALVLRSRPRAGLGRDERERPAPQAGGSRNKGQGGPAQRAGGSRRTGTGTRRKGRGVPVNSRRASRHKGSSTSRGYGYGHRQLRAWWVPRVASGLVKCWRCGVVIRADEQWHLGHDDGNRNVYKGPEHVVCNVSTNRSDRKDDPKPMIDQWWNDV